MTESCTKFAALKAKPEKDMSVEVEISEDDSEEEDSSEDMKKKEDMAAELADIKALLANFGAKPVAPSVAATTAKTEVKAPTNFSEALTLVKAEGLSGTAATKEVIARYPDLFLAARNSGIRNL